VSGGPVDVVVIGAGMGGLASALACVGAGLRVTLIDEATEVGGKVRVARTGDRAIDCGPTVLTMRGVFEELFAGAGLRLDEHVHLRALDVLARHLWPDGSQLDLFADVERSAAAIESFAGAKDADGFRRFVQYGATLLDALEEPFLRHDNRGLFALMTRVGPRGLARLAKVDFGRSMWRALEDFFTDPRLRQLFARYATYYGSSPYAAPATLNLIAQVEQRGVWSVEGGMAALVRAVADAFVARGGELRLGHCAVRLERAGPRIAAVVLDDGTRIACRHVVFNGDPTRVADGGLGHDIRDAVRTIAAPRSLSAMTWSFVGRPTGVPLAYHTVCFSRDYAAEFADLFEHHRVPIEPTTYVCASDRAAGPASGAERLMCLINAPAGAFDDEEATCRTRMEQSLRACGIATNPESPMIHHGPADLARRFSGTQGAIYGSATHGAMAPFRRYRSSTRIANLHLVGGAVHPGAGLPMVTLGGLAAAKRIAADLASTLQSSRAGTSGGTSTVSMTRATTRSP
jgi:1-hydroxycarotenoid 3,4-desaturase